MTGGAGVTGCDFFVSYTAADAAWAEWIAWVLEDEGYRVVIQAWDFGAGAHFVGEMHRAAQRAARTVAVLSADYLRSAFATEEWQTAWAADPTGAARTLLAFRVADCDRPGLLRQLVTVDLFGLDRAAARDRLLKAVRAERGKPQAEPAFPGTGGGEPAFPGLAGRDPLAQLRYRLQRLHRHNGEPSSREISRRAGKVISHTTVSGVLRCERNPRWGQLEAVVEALAGDLDEFRRLWIAVRDAEHPPGKSSTAHVPPPRPAGGAPPTTGPDNIGADSEFEEFEFLVDAPKDRQVVRSEDLPLLVEGRYSGSPRPIRVILEDSHGQYYVQNPPVRFQSDGTWRATNVLPGTGIMFVLFVMVDDGGKNLFDQMVKHRDFGAFYELPPGSQVLLSLAITRV